MGRIIKKVTVTGTKTTENVKALFDSGADKSYIKPELAERLGIVETITDKWDVEIGGGIQQGVKEVELVEMKIDNSKISKPRFLVGDWVEFPVIIGAEPMQTYGVELIMVEEKPEIKFIHPRAKYASMKQKPSGEFPYKLLHHISLVQDGTLRGEVKEIKNITDLPMYDSAAEHTQIYKNSELIYDSKVSKETIWEFTGKYPSSSETTKPSTEYGSFRSPKYSTGIPGVWEVEDDEGNRLRLVEDIMELAYGETGAIRLEEGLYKKIHRESTSETTVVEGFEEIPRDQVPETKVYQETIPHPYYSSLNIYVDEKGIKYAIPIIKGPNIAFREKKT